MLLSPPARPHFWTTKDEGYQLLWVSPCQYLLLACSPHQTVLPLGLPGGLHWCCPQPFCPSAPPYPMGQDMAAGEGIHWLMRWLRNPFQIPLQSHPCCARSFPWLSLVAAEHRSLCIFLLVAQSFHSHVPTQVLDAS